MNSYLTRIKGRFGMEAMRGVEELYNELGLPLPGFDVFNRNGAKNDFYYEGDGTPVFLNPYGAVLRVQCTVTMPLIQHENLLRPIAAVQITDGCRVDIQPGLPYLPAADSPVDTALDMLQVNDIRLADNSDHNFMTAPYSDPSLRNPQVVNFDPAEIIKLNSSVRECAAFISGSQRILDLSPHKALMPDDQYNYYNALISAFTSARDPKTDSLTSEGVGLFWSAMRTATQKGTLSSSWLTLENADAGSDREACSVSIAYAEKLNESRPHELAA